MDGVRDLGTGEPRRGVSWRWWLKRVRGGVLDRGGVFERGVPPMGEVKSDGWAGAGM